MSDPEHEKAFEDYLSRRAGISPRPADPEDLEPPAELDRIVLANAREAIRIRNSLPPFRFARWVVPFGAVATLVLSFAVLLHLGLLSPKATREVQKVEAQLGLEQPQQQMRAETASDSAAPAANVAAAPATSAAITAAVPAAPPSPERATRRALAEDPKVWLKRIETLRAQGKASDADRELEAFRKAWPDYPVDGKLDR